MRALLRAHTENVSFSTPQHQQPIRSTHNHYRV